MPSNEQRIAQLESQVDALRDEIDAMRRERQISQQQRNIRLVRTAKFEGDAYPGEFDDEFPILFVDGEIQPPSPGGGSPSFSTEDRQDHGVEWMHVVNEDPANPEFIPEGTLWLALFDGREWYTFPLFEDTTGGGGGGDATCAVLRSFSGFHPGRSQLLGHRPGSDDDDPNDCGIFHWEEVLDPC